MVGCEWRLKAEAPGRALVLTPPCLTSSANSFLMLLTLTVNSLIFQFVIFSARSLPLGRLVLTAQLQRLTYPGFCGGGNPVGSGNPLTISYEIINSNLRLLVHRHKVYAWLSRKSCCVFFLLFLSFSLLLEISQVHQLQAYDPTYWTCSLRLLTLLWKVIQLSAGGVRASTPVIGLFSESVRVQSKNASAWTIPASIFNPDSCSQSGFGNKVRTFFLYWTKTMIFP